MIDIHRNVMGATGEQMKVMELRGEFAKRYCAEKGWNINALSIEQILEIRSKPEWKKPGTEVVE